MMDAEGMRLQVDRLCDEIAAELRRVQRQAHETRLIDIEWHANCYASYISLAAALATVGALAQMRHPAKGGTPCN